MALPQLKLGPSGRTMQGILSRRVLVVTGGEVLRVLLHWGKW